jgi:hypothetical protein
LKKKKTRQITIKKYVLNWKEKTNDRIPLYFDLTMWNLKRRAREKGWRRKKFISLKPNRYFVVYTHMTTRKMTLNRFQHCRGKRHLTARKSFTYCLKTVKALHTLEAALLASIFLFFKLYFIFIKISNFLSIT